VTGSNVVAGSDHTGSVGSGSDDTEMTMRRVRNPRGQGARLREDMLDAAGRLLDAAGREDAVSLRAVAREVGVVPQSVYLHFADREELLLAVLSRRFAELSAEGDRAEQSETGAAGRLRARCLALCRYGLTHPARYKLLLERYPPRRVDVPVEALPGTASFEALAVAVQRCLDAGLVRADRPRDAHLLTADLLAALHGATSLRINAPTFPWPPIDDCVERVLTGLVGVVLPPAEQAPSPSDSAGTGTCTELPSSS
jgi:AcrR family transcriptional regulator